MEELVPKLLASQFRLELRHCELRQCVTDSPIVYKGQGVISQEADGNLLLRVVHSEEIAEDEKFRRFFGNYLTPGEIIPDEEYFDLSAVDSAGYRWRASRQSIDADFRGVTEVVAKLKGLERVESWDDRQPRRLRGVVRSHRMCRAGRCRLLPRRTRHLLHRCELGSVMGRSSRRAAPVATPVCHRPASRNWFVPVEKVELPWNELTRDDKGTRFDRFEYSGDQYSWLVKKVDNGLFVEFRSLRGTLEQDAKAFMWGLAIMLGKPMMPIASQTVNRCARVTRLHARRSKLGAMLLPPLPRKVHPPYAVSFLRLFVENALVLFPARLDQARVIYQFWNRILRAQERDIENSSLVLSVAIEGLLKDLFHSEHDRDESFAPLAAAAEPVIQTAAIDERVRTALLKSLKNAGNPKPKDAFYRLIEQGAIRSEHVKAWDKMRHTGAHGGLLGDSDRELQKHLDRYHVVLDLFYRLVFVAIGYRGPHCDYSVKYWPDATFPSQADSVA